STWLNKGSNGDLYYGAEADGALQYFLSPANDDAREFLLKTFKYIWTTYDDVVSFQLDYIRYPGTTSAKSFGYDDGTMEKFKASEYYNSSKHTTTYLKSLTASDNENNTGAYDPQWVQFRANLVTTFIEEVRSEMATVAPGLYLSASPDPEMAAAKKLKMQDVEYWLNHDLIDILYPMAYGENVPGMVAPELVENNPKHFVCVGTAASYNSDDYEARWLKEVRDAGADGIAGFGTIDSWKNYAWSIDAVSPIGNASRAGRVYAMDTVCDRADQMLKLGAITAAQCALIKEKAAVADETFRLTGIESADSLYAINALQTVADGLSNANAKAALTKDVNYLLKIRNNSKDAKKQATELKESDFTLGVNGETYSNAQTAATYIAGSNTLYVKENGTVLSGSTLGYVTVLAKEGVSKLEFNRVTFSAGNGLLQGNGIEASAPLTIELTGKNTVTAETLSNVTCKYMGTGQLYNGDELVVFMGDIVDNKKLDSDDIRAMETLLGRIYGPVSLQYMTARTGKSQLIMLNEGD
ncbi:MAG: family 10 glycosylhydrolase, partial [Clostridia bacterium]|nr:family 10 glycosylhydrolase [Clostridia bacterium]